MKRDNLKNFRSKQIEINTKLIQKAIDNILNLEGVLTNNNVSKTTYLVADEKLGETGITPSAISKNNIYKSLIQKAKYRKNDKSNVSYFSSSGDIKMELFKLKVEQEKLKKENIILKKLLKKYGGDLTMIDITNYEDNEKSQLIKQASKGLIQRLFELGLIEHNCDTGELVLVHLGDVLLNEYGYSLIIGDK
ncbi:hypothetical protein [Aliarcobacter butzleri]|uniref:hypothetical protein n=1 Tax=Aliarcobacter butzleri TaxID=28197 RepID=UPI001EDC2CA9|nr:hypothetical protein [Aliarcobacter butzleri]MCG3683869.1 hypothetical protein [Aliarcobacter butzleri]